MTSKLLRRSITVILCALLAVSVFSCAKHAEEEFVPEAERVLEFGEPKYVGSDKCKSCHWREHDSWKHTLHSRFAQSPDEFSVIGDFINKNTLSVKVRDRNSKFAGKKVTAKMRVSGGKYYVNTIGPDGKSHDYEIFSTIGLNLRQNYLTKFSNGEIHVLPVEWHADKDAWVDFYGPRDHSPGDGDFWSDAGRIWQFKCGGCHVTGLEINYNQATKKFDTKWTEMGIGCEMCHGPASNHLKAAKEYFQDEKETILNPGKLPVNLRAMVCGQCHSLGKSTAEISPSGKGFPKNYSFPVGYLPGKSLPLYADIKGPHADDWQRNRQYNEWKQSVHAERGIMCATCHAVHQEGAHKSPNKAQTKLPADNLCKGCHTSEGRRAAHKIHTFGSCIDCHMPRLYGKSRSHKFEFVSPAKSVLAGGVDKQPNSCSGCHFHKDTPLENLVEFLNAAKKRDMPKPFSAHRRKVRE